MNLQSVAENNFESLQHFVPELILVAGIVVILLVDVIFDNRRGEQQQGHAGPAIPAFAALVAAGLWLRPLQGAPPSAEFLGMVALDPFGWFFRLFAVGATAITVLMAARSRETRRTNAAELYVLLLVMCLAMMFLATANDLVMLYLALETLSITSYILTGYLGSRRGAEASLKYLLYGAVASGTMLFGLSLLYGLAGSTDIQTVAAAIGGGGVVSAVAAVMVFCGFAYKMAAAPFHMWAPDVYEGAPTPVTAILTVGSKAAGFAAFMRFFLVVLAEPTPGAAGGADWAAIGLDDWPMALAVVSALTMTIGNMAALGQTNIKRLLGYSSIAHAGYMLMGVLALSQAGVRAVLFYMLVYYAMNLGAFLVVTIVANHAGSENIEDFKGLGWRTPVAGAAMALFLFSLVGLPPLAGFIGKYHLFAALIERGLSASKEWYYALAIFAALNSAVSLFYYARVVKVMYLDTPGDTSPIPVSKLQHALLATLAVPTLVLGVAWGPVMRDWVHPSTQMLDDTAAPMAQTGTQAPNLAQASQTLGTQSRQQN